MELKDFIKTALRSITEGIVEAQKELADKEVIINPEKMEMGKNGNAVLRYDGWRYVQNLDFEIQVAIEESTEKGAKGKLKVLDIVSIGGDRSSEMSISNANRLKFSLPVAFPTAKTPEDYKPKKRPSTKAIVA